MDLFSGSHVPIWFYLIVIIVVVSFIGFCSWWMKR